MKVLLLAFFFSCVSLAAQATDSPASQNGWGPGENGECVDPETVALHLQTYDHCFIGSSLYRKEFGVRAPNERSRPLICLRKIADFPFTVQAVEPDWGESGEGVRIWSDGGEYWYAIDSNELQYVDSYGILGPFLTYPIVGAGASHGRYGCFGGTTNEVDHNAVAVDTAVPSLRHEVSSIGSDRRRGSEINGVDLEDLTWALRSVNLEAHRLPSLSEFGFESGDLVAYYQRVKEDAAEIDSLEEGEFFRFDYPYAPTADRRDLFHLLPMMMDTIGPDIVAPALLANRNAWGSTSSEAFEVALINEVNDTLFCRFWTNGPDQPLNLPWTIRYGEAEFHTFNVELATLLMQLLPEDAGRSVREDRVNVLYAVAWYLGEVRMWQGEGTRSEE